MTATSTLYDRGVAFRGKLSEFTLCPHCRDHNALFRYYGANAGSVLAGALYIPRHATRFNAHPKHPAVPYLVRLHADLGGQIKANQTEAVRLADAMKHVEAVIKIYDPEFSVPHAGAIKSIVLKSLLAPSTGFRRGGNARDRTLNIFQSLPKYPLTAGIYFSIC